MFHAPSKEKKKKNWFLVSAQFQIGLEDAASKR
jgi:hypothetical protein